jgi:hypothetical protein
MFSAEINGKKKSNFQETPQFPNNDFNKKKNTN